MPREGRPRFLLTCPCVALGLLLGPSDGRPRFLFGFGSAGGASAFESRLLRGRPRFLGAFSSVGCCCCCDASDAVAWMARMRLGEDDLRALVGQQLELSAIFGLIIFTCHCRRCRVGMGTRSCADSRSRWVDERPANCATRMTGQASARSPRLSATASLQVMVATTSEPVVNVGLSFSLSVFHRPPISAVHLQSTG